MAKEEYYTDPETGKKYKLSDFDDSRSMVKAKKKIKENVPNLLGKVKVN